MARSGKRKVPWNSSGYIGYGFLGVVVGGLIAGLVAAAVGPDIGVIVWVVVAVISGIWLTIGLIGKGVAVGMREHTMAQALERYLTEEDREERKGVF